MLNTIACMLLVLVLVCKAYMRGRRNGIYIGTVGGHTATIDYMKSCKKKLDQQLRSNIGSAEDGQEVVPIGNYIAHCKSTREVARLSEAIGELLDQFTLLPDSYVVAQQKEWQ